VSVNWLDPQPIGVDAFGTTHHLQTVGTHTAFYGKTQSGKTTAARGLVSLGVLDPRVDVVVLNGKPDEDMWLPMRDLCSGYVEGATSRTVVELRAELERLNEINDSRAGGDKGRSRPMIVVVDELYRLRQAAKRAGKKTADEIDGLFADMASTCSGRHMHMVFCAQRGTVEFIPGDLGANLGQRVQGWAASPKEIGYAIHSRPDVEPGRQGEFLVSIDEGGTSELVSVPFLDHAGFREVCAAARRLRAAPVVDLTKHHVEPDQPATWQELVAVILEESREPMTTTAIYEALPEGNRPTPHAETFGRLLNADADSPDPLVTRSYTRSRTRAWSLAAPAEPAPERVLSGSARSEAPTRSALAGMP
jgi:hypothetical protein